MQFSMSRNTHVDQGISKHTESSLENNGIALRDKKTNEWI